MFESMDGRLVLVLGVVALIGNLFLFAQGIGDGSVLRILLGGAFSAGSAYLIR